MAAASASTDPRATRRAWARGRSRWVTATPFHGAPISTSSTREWPTIPAAATSSPTQPGSVQHPVRRASATRWESDTPSDAYEELKRRLSGPSPSLAAPIFLLRRECLQVSDEVFAFLRVGNGNAHLLPGDELLRVGEPARERLLAPDHARGSDRGGIRIARRRARLAPEHAAMRGPDLVLVHRVAGGAIGLVEILAPRRIARGRRRKA